MKIKLIVIIAFLGHLVFSQESEIKLNDIRILASHNSYKKLPSPKVIRFLSHFKKQLGPTNDPIQLDYGHVPIEEQLSEYNIRGLELDIYYDPKGKLYRKRKLNRFIRGETVRNRDPKMSLPGFKLLHIPDIDFESNYLTFQDALKSINSWSKNHQNHTPIFINIETKGSSAADESRFLRFIGFKRALRYDSLAYALLDQEILSVFNRNQLYTPTDLKSNYSSVKSRLENVGWPKLSECLGKVFFILQGSNDFIYKSSLIRNEERVMFVYDEPGGENTAFVLRNESQGVENNINVLTNLYIVRSRTDAGTLQSRDNNYQDFESVMKSNAQIISTDYYKADLRWSNFQINISGINKDKPYILRQ